MNLPLAPLPEGARGRVLAFALLAVAVGLFWAAVISPLVEWYGSRAETLAERRILLAHMTALADSLPTLRRTASHSGAGVPQRTELLDGESDAIAGAGLQGMVQEMASEAGATLASTEALPAEQRGEYRRIGVRITLNEDWSVLVALLQAIETNPIQLLVDDLQLHAVARVGPSGRTAGAPQIDTSLIVVGFRAGRAAGAASGPTPVSQRVDAPSHVDVALTDRGPESAHGQETGIDAR
jgi:general secretion pathway protein M